MGKYIGVPECDEKLLRYAIQTNCHVIELILVCNETEDLSTSLIVVPSIPRQGELLELAGEIGCEVFAVVHRMCKGGDFPTVLPMVYARRVDGGVDPVLKARRLSRPGES